MSFAFFKKGKGQHGANNLTTKDDIFLVKVEKRLSQYINDPEFISKGDIVQTINEATLVSAEHISGLTFKCTAENFPIVADGKYYRAVPNDELTLNPEDDEDRIDLIIAVKPSVEGGLGYITKITGEPSATPSPPDYDYSRHFPIKFVYVKNAAESTGEPVGFLNETIFNENLGEPTEWTFSTNSPSTIQVSTDESSSGTNSVEFTTLSSFNSARFTNDVSVNNSNINLLTFKIKLKAPYKTNKTINLFFRQSTGGVYYLFIKNGEYGFNANSLDWQKITIPMSTITPSFSFNALWLGFNDTNHLGCYVDEIKLQGESDVVTPPVSDVIPNLQEVTDKGNVTNNNIEVESDTQKWIQAANVGFTRGVYLDTEGYLNTNYDGNYIDLDPANKRIVFGDASNPTMFLNYPETTSPQNIDLPDKSGTISLVEPNSDTITTSTNITNATLTDGGYSQEGKVIGIENGVNAINYTVNGGITASFVLRGTGAVTFVQGSGRTLVSEDNNFVLDNQNKRASIVSYGTVDILKIDVGGSIYIQQSDYYLTNLMNNKHIISNGYYDKIVTIPNDITENLPIGFKCDVVWRNDGKVTINAESGVTVLKDISEDLVIKSENNAVTLIKENNNEWGVFGALNKTGDTPFSRTDGEIVLSPSDTSLTSLAWVSIYKSSEWLEVTTTKDYFIIYSSDHNGSLGGIYWGECDDPKLTNFVENGKIIDGYQAEYARLIKIPIAESGLATDTLFLYYHTDATDPSNAGLQQTHLITTSGGLLHTATWTQRGTVLGLETGETHTGYLQVIKRGVSDYVGFHLTVGGVDNYWISTSVDGLNWTRVKRIESPEYTYLSYYWGVWKLTHNGIDYVMGVGLGGFSVFTYDQYYRPITPLVTSQAFNQTRDFSMYYENGIIHCLRKEGTSNADNLHPFRYFNFSLNNVL